MSTDSKFYVCTESDELFTDEQFEKRFHVYVENGEITDLTHADYEYYLNCCMTHNNGSLVKVTKVSKDETNNMVHNGDIPQKYACMFLDGDLFKSEYGRYYLVDPEDWRTHRYIDESYGKRTFCTFLGTYDEMIENLKEDNEYE